MTSARTPRARNIWVVGGGNLAAQFAAAGLLDEIILSVIPVILGDGQAPAAHSGPDAAA